MPNVRWDHIHLRSFDPESTARYYVDVFGATITNRIDVRGFLRIILDLAGLNLFIEEVPQGTPAPPAPPFLGLEHIGFATTNLESVCADLKARGADIAVAPHSPRPGVKVAFVLGPDNVRIELLERSPVT
jgi:catechol 2,3-dioxygenase-like lactoylglutathione lyase family enzyme